MGKSAPRCIARGDDPQYGVTPRKISCQRASHARGARFVTTICGMPLRFAVRERSFLCVTEGGRGREMALMPGMGRPSAIVTGGHMDIPEYEINTRFLSFPFRGGLWNQDQECNWTSLRRPGFLFDLISQRHGIAWACAVYSTMWLIERQWPDQPALSGSLVQSKTFGFTISVLLQGVQ
jgi:hypothetical protein